MNIRQLSVEIIPCQMYRNDAEMECRVEVIADGQKFTHIHIIPRDDFVNFFERCMDLAQYKITEMVKEHEHGTIISPKGRRSSKDS